MTNLSKELCRRFAEVRRAKGLSQTALAARIGCQQSALSMFEGGMPTKLSDETVAKLSDFLGVPLEEEKKEEAPAAPVAAAPFVPAGGFCPNCHCLSNVPYVIDGRIFFRPARQYSGERCAQCGEILEKRCPVCGAPLNEGACCAVCGAAYVTPVLPEGTDPGAYALARREEIAELRNLF